MIDEACFAYDEPLDSGVQLTVPKSRKRENNRRKVENLIEEKRLRKELEDDVLQEKSRTYYDDDLFTDFYKKD